MSSYKVNLCCECADIGISVRMIELHYNGLLEGRRRRAASSTSWVLVCFIYKLHTLVSLLLHRVHTPTITIALDIHPLLLLILLILSPDRYYISTHQIISYRYNFITNSVHSLAL